MVRKHEEIYYTNPGSPIRDVYSPVVHEDGKITIEVSGKENTDEIIQSFAESCDIRVIVNRFNGGDLTALNQARGMYGDFTEMPKTYAEALQMRIDAKNAFDKLNPDIKKQFNYNVDEFLATAGDEEWYKKLGVENALKENVPEVSSEAAEERS